MEQHFVTFYSPGTFVAETTAKPIDSWDVDKARAMAAEIVERYDAKPYGFRFTTRGREDHELDSHEIAHSPMHYLKGRIETLAQIEARADPKESILLGNMRSNGWNRVITSVEGWKWTQPLNDGDVVLDAA
jgi:hypothetical protein